MILVWYAVINEGQPHLPIFNPKNHEMVNGHDHYGHLVKNG